MNKLDLVFEKEPPEVQRKLMSLLVQYNAMMQYNPNQQKYQVDLLLPFKNQEQKQLFLKNFQSRNHRSEPRKNSYHSASQRKNSQYETAPHSIPNPSKQEEELQQQQNKGLQSPKSTSPKNKSQNYNQLQLEPELSFQLTNQHDTSGKRDFPISVSVSLADISNAVRGRLREAVRRIREGKNGVREDIGERTVMRKINFSRMEEQEPVLEQLNIPQQQEDEESNLLESHRSSPRQKPSQIDDHIKQPYQPSENVQNFNRNKSFENYSQTHQVSMNNSSHPSHVSGHSNSNSNSINMSNSKDEILIQGEEQFDYGQTFHNSQDFSHNSNNNNHNNTNYSSSYEYPNTIEERMEEDDEELFQKRSSGGNGNGHGDESGKSGVESKIQQMKNKLNKKYNSKKMTSSGHNLRNKYKDFLKKNHKDIERLYENIKKDIKRVEKVQKESQLHHTKRKGKDPILVLEEDAISSVNSQEDRIFKEEIIKDYHTRIIAQNQNMSSEDLVRYFRYLLQHAKSLYSKQVRIGK